MTRIMYIAAVFAFATVLTQANQCTNGGGGCTGDSVPQNIVSMLQTKLKTNVLKDDVQDNSNKQIAELMAQEKDAIASEDLVSAQNLKTEINALQSKAASSGVLHAGADVDGKKESLVGNMLMLNKPAAILTEFEQKVTAGEVPAFDVISQIKTLVTDDIMPYLQDSRDQAIQQATELRALVTACNDDFKSSDAYPGSTMEQAVNTARSNHITCRDVQDTAHAFNLTQPDSYCVKLGELLHDTMPLSSPGASASPRATSVASVVSALHTMPSCNSDVLQLDANCTQQETELANKHQECSLKQETFEFRFCEWKDGLESKCKTLDSCYSTTSGLYNAHVAQMKTSLEKWDVENKTLHTILCYCNVWLRSTDSADNRSQHNASHFEACKVSTHPTEVVELVPTQKDDCMLGSVSNHPGTQAFTDQEYGSVTDFVAPVIPCIPDCGVNEKIVENVCVACPAGKTSPGRNSTICDATLCGTDEKVVGHICVKCAPGKMSMSNNDASGADTQCQATKCGANEKVVDHVCVQCPAGKIGSGDDDASGGNTQCEATTTTTTTTEAAMQMWTVVPAMTDDNTFFLKQDGSVYASGSNYYGILGDGTHVCCLLTPAFIMNGVKAVAAGKHHSLFLKQDGSVYAAGHNAYGQLGDGTAGDCPNFHCFKSTPVFIMNGVKAVAAGEIHSFFLKQDGSLYAAGSNRVGQLGDGKIVYDGYSTPVLIMNGVKAVAAGGYHLSFFLKQNGTVYGVGTNHEGNLGDGTRVSKSTPVPIMNGVRAVAAGHEYSLFLKQDGSVYAAGSNGFGQLGLGTIDRTSTPTLVMNGVKAVAAGSWHALFLKQDGTAYAVGRNSWGNLGDGTRVNRYQPVLIMNGVKGIAAGRSGSFFLKQDDTVWACGENQAGELGDGTRSFRGGSPILIRTLASQ